MSRLDDHSPVPAAGLPSVDAPLDFDDVRADVVKDLEHTPQLVSVRRFADDPAPQHHLDAGARTVLGPNPPQRHPNGDLRAVIGENEAKCLRRLAPSPLTTRAATHDEVAIAEPTARPARDLHERHGPLRLPPEPTHARTVPPTPGGNP